MVNPRTVSSSHWFGSSTLLSMFSPHLLPLILLFPASAAGSSGSRAPAVTTTSLNNSGGTQTFKTPASLSLHRIKTNILSKHFQNKLIHNLINHHKTLFLLFFPIFVFMVVLINIQCVYDAPSSSINISYK